MKKKIYSLICLFIAVIAFSLVFGSSRMEPEPPDRAPKKSLPVADYLCVETGTELIRVVSDSYLEYYVVEGAVLTFIEEEYYSLNDDNTVQLLSPGIIDVAQSFKWENPDLIADSGKTFTLIK